MKHFDYVKINSVNPFYLIIGKVDEYIEEKNGNEYLTLVSTDKNKEVSIKHTELWDKIKSLIKTINGEAGEYGEDYMKTKFNSDDNLPFTKILKFHNLTIAIGSAFQEDGKYCSQVFLEECLYEL